ncbi:MAG: family acetyltransferase [Burkholderiaceae bacterium]|nr:family acetyltransferase [Burkholderiaceae bacterium]
MSFTIRPLQNTPDEYQQWLALWHGYLTFYESTVSDEVTARNWASFHDPDNPIDALGAFDVDGKMIGLVQTVIHLSTWSVAPHCYLSDLFTTPEARRQGVGRALIEAVYAFAKGKGCVTVHWLTHESNVTGQSLYNELAVNEGFIQYLHVLKP